jgi:hypothetical protein
VTPDEINATFARSHRREWPAIARLIMREHFHTADVDTDFRDSEIAIYNVFQDLRFVQHQIFRETTPIRERKMW